MAFAAAEAAPTAAAEAEAAGSTFASASNVAEVMAAAAAAAAVFVVTDANPSLERRVVDLAECGVCVGLLFEPTTAPCGHSFCRQCLLRSLRHSPRCPTCRAYVGGGGAHAVNYALRQLVQQLAPQAYAARGAEAAAEPPVELEELGLFALEPLLPRQAMALFVFEPRYRRLVQACLGGSRRFGMMAPLGGNAVTEVEVTETTQLEGGRYLIQIVGRRRMNILRSWTSDHGYRVAAVEPLFDEPLAAADAGADAARSAAQQFSELAQQLDGEVALWCARVRLRRGRAQQVDALLAQLGDMPRDNPEDLGLWLAVRRLHVVCNGHAWARSRRPFAYTARRRL
mmetsp:Transcript_26063/g.92974  ORF Transcript_26063/g.92974 Transcript_26063/m.92974 type:complete len:341 (+) Transcript_26063:298-1320(+)